MSDASHEIVFQPDGKSVTVLDGCTLLEAASRAGLVLEAPCGGNGACGKCRVQVVGDGSDPSGAERDFFSDDELADGWRLACQRTIHGEMTVVVPEGSRYYEQRILTEGIEREVALEPNIRKTFVELEAPTVADQRSDLDRISDALDADGRRLRPSLELTRTIPAKLRRNDFAVTLVTEAGELVALESGDSTTDNYGVAIDLGTTTVVGMLVCLNTGHQIAVAARGNPQTAYGDDVIARISHCMECDDGVGELQSKAIDCVNEIVADLCEQVGASPRRVYEVCVAGNTTMTHLLLGVPPDSLAAAPYVGAIRQSFSVKGAPMGLRVNRHARLYTLPTIAGFVGGDTVGVILAAGLHESDELMLAVDIGTNGEIVLGSRERLVTCSTAAGPAFEGARIEQGMRATTGAIDKTRVNDGVAINVIGGGLARGICGTGLIDVVAQLIEVGVVDMGGRLNGPDALPPTVSDEVRARLSEAKGGYRFLLAAPEQSENGNGVYITQSDVRELQLAKSAIMAGITLLARELDVRVDDIQHVLLAGAFGNYINPRSARIIGLIPDLPDERLQFIGNAASAGARMTLVSSSRREVARNISRQTDYIEMASLREFQDEYMMQMMFMPCQNC